MPKVEIYVSQSDIDAAKRIAEKMFPEKPDLQEARFVVASAAYLGIESLKVVWEDKPQKPEQSE